MKNFLFQEVLFEFDEIDSTQSEAKRIIRAGEGGTVFIVTAKTQTSGRGRIERRWDSPVGNIYMTIAFTTEYAGDFAEILPLYTAFALMEAIGEKAKYKWVNDVIIENKKVAGILIEKIGRFFVVGIGVNLNVSPQDTMFIAGNLKEFDLSVSVFKIFESFTGNLHLRREYVLNYLKNRFFSRDQITINQGEFVGIFHNITNDGALILKGQNGNLKEICFGDVGMLI